MKRSEILVIIPSGPSRGNRSEAVASKMRDFGFHVVRTDGDVGFSEAVNDGLMEVFFNPTFRYAWILNDDTNIFKDPFPEIKWFYTEFMPFAIMGHKIVSLDDKDTILFGGAGDPYPAGMHKTGSLKAGDLNEMTYEKWITFASVIIPAEVIYNIGLLDERMKWVYSDSDYCYRARWAGYPCIYNPNIVIFHEGGVSSKPDSDERIMQFRLDALMFEAKWINGYAYFSLNSEKFDAIDQKRQENLAPNAEDLR